MLKIGNCFRLFIIIMPLLFGQNTQAQTVVNSLAELLPYLDDDNVNVKLSPGTYNIGFSETYLPSGAFYGKNSLLLFEGSNSTYDFTDVIINFDTLIFNAFKKEVKEVYILGNNNILKNLTMVDIGSTVPQYGALGITMDGRDNKVEGFHLTIRGSYPYGYGDAFGKGGTNNIIRHKKHSGILIRGLRNHLKNTTLISRSYGHCIFMQAASYPTVEGCYVEGETRSTDDMLAEEGTGSAADNVDFMTTWGYRLPGGYMMSLQEEGIRAYNAGTTYIDGVEIKRGTDNPTVLNCTVKYTRGGVTLAHATGVVRVENCTTIGCEQGYGIGSGAAINCKTDVSHGHAFKSTYDNDSWDLDIEIIPAVDPYYNGQKAIAFIGMDNSNLTLTGGDPNLPSDYRIQVGGTLDGVRFKNGNLDHQSTHNGNSNSIVNYTLHPMDIVSGSSGNTIITCGEITDNGSNNDIEECDQNYLNFPDPNVTYYFNNPRTRLRLSGNGGDDVDLVAETSTGTNTEWKITPSGEAGYYFIDCVGSGTNARIASDGTVYPDMDPVTLNEERSRWRFDEYAYGYYHVTAENNDRLNVNNNQLEIVDASNVGLTTIFTFTLVPTLSAKMNMLEDDMMLYPNPTSSFLNVKLSNPNSVKVDVMNLSGQVVLSKHIENNDNQIDLTNIAAGVYLVKIVSGDQVYTQKVVKE